MHAPTFRLSRRSANRDESGSTLIEVLIALVLIGIISAALLGAFASAISASGTHRTLTSLDAVLRNLVESAKSEIQQQTNPEFTNCATSYVLASAPMPQTGGAGSTVTVFAVGLDAGASYNRDHWFDDRFVGRCRIRFWRRQRDVHDPHEYLHARQQLQHCRL